MDELYSMRNDMLQRHLFFQAKGKGKGNTTQVSNENKVFGIDMEEY